MEKKIILAKDMQLADVVQMVGGFNEGWGASIVKQVTDQDVTIFRPYGHHANFSYTGGVICYVGIDEYNLRRDSSVEYELLRRTELK